MAMKLNGDVAKKGNNSSTMKTDLMEAANRILGLKKEVAKIQEEIQEVKAKQVKAHGIKMVDFNTVLRWYSLELYDRNETVDNIRVCCEALSVGVQGALFPGNKTYPNTDAEKRP